MLLAHPRQLQPLRHVGGRLSRSEGCEGAIALSVLTIANPFFIEIADNLKAEAARHGYDVLVVSGDNNVARQQNR